MAQGGTMLIAFYSVELQGIKKTVKVCFSNNEPVHYSNDNPFDHTLLDMFIQWLSERNIKYVDRQ